MRNEALSPEAAAVLKGYGLEPERLSGCALCRFESGETVIAEGAPVEKLYIVLGGRIRVGMTAANGRALTLCYYVSDGILGDVELVMKGRAGSATSAAVRPSDCIAIPLDANAAYMTGCAPFMNRVAAELAAKLLNSGSGYIASALYSGEARLCAYILIHERDGLFSEILADTAKAIGVSYRHLCRLMNGLCHAGALERSAAGFRIRDRRYIADRSAY